MILRFVLFFSVLLLLLGATSWYVARRFSHVFALGPKGRRRLAVVLGAALVVAIAARALEGHVPSYIVKPLGLGAFAVVFGVLLTWLPLLVLHALSGLGPRLRRVRSSWRASRSSPTARELEPAQSAEQPPSRTEPRVTDAPTLSRRSLLEQAAAATVVAVGFGASGYGTFYGRRAWTLEQVPLAIPRLSPRLDGLVIAQISDVHLGLFVQGDELEAAEGLVREAGAELIVLTGDMIDHDARYAADLERFVGRLKQLAPRGVVAIPGNHDYYAGVEPTLAAITRAGGRVLLNRGEIVGDGENGLALLGVDDVWAPRVDAAAAGPDLDAAIGSLPPHDELPRIVLCHNPITFSAHAHRVALQLSGHTHGSQVNLGRSLTSLFLRHPYVAGHHRSRDAQLYVNRGFGTAGPPTRIGSRPEVTRLVLRGA